MFKNIVVPLDLSDKQSAKLVFPTVLNFASAFGAKIHLVHIIPNFGVKIMEDYLPRNWINDQKTKCKILFDNVIKKFVPDEIKVEYYLGRGAIYDEIISYSKKVDADLIIISAVRPQLKDYMLGPNASKIVRHSAISVMVVRD